MGVRKTVFASVSERENFQKLSRQWGDEYRIYHNLPFLNVLEPKNIFTLWKWPIEQMVIPEIDLNRLKKTSLDYTLCDEQDTPILSIEFDGMEEGYNAGTAYHTDLPGSAWRKHMMELKLQVAHGSFYPFFVVGTDEFRDFASDIKLTIVDGIIGEVLSKRATHDLLAKGFHPEEYGMTNEEFGALPQERQNFYIEDFVFSAETMGTMTFGL